MSSINLVINKALWGLSCNILLKSQISLLRLYQYQNDFTGKFITGNTTDKTIIYARRRSSWIVILSIRHKLVYDVVKNRPLFGILPLCPCKSIGRCISETGHLDTPVMLGTNKNSRRPTSSWNSSSFLIHLIVSAPPSTSAEDKTHFGFLLQQLPYLLLLSLSQRLFVNAFRPLSAKPWVGGGPRSLPSFGVPRLPLCDDCTYRMFLCSTETQKSSPLSRLITHPSAMPCSLSS